jgi:hypothetical protein
MVLSRTPKKRLATIRFGYIMVFFIQILAAALMFGALGHEKWIEQGEDDG